MSKISDLAYTLRRWLRVAPSPVGPMARKLYAEGWKHGEGRGKLKLDERHYELLERVVETPGPVAIRAVRTEDTRHMLRLLTLADAHLVRVRAYETHLYHTYRTRWANMHGKHHMVASPCTDVIWAARPTQLGLEVAAQRKAINDAKRSAEHIQVCPRCGAESA